MMYAYKYQALQENIRLGQVVQSSLLTVFNRGVGVGGNYISFVASELV